MKGREGIRLTDAMDPYFGGLDDRDDLMFAGDTVGTSVSCRNHVRVLYGGALYCRSTPLSLA